jgi:hypothetical protein
MSMSESPASGVGIAWESDGDAAGVALGGASDGDTEAAAVGGADGATDAGWLDAAVPPQAAMTTARTRPAPIRIVE